MMKLLEPSVLLIVLLCPSCNSTGNDELWYAAHRGDTNTLGRYLRNGGDINRQIRYKLVGPNTATLLHIAIEACNPTAIRYLLENGADPNILNYWGRTPVSLAIGGPCMEGLKLLLEHGADPNKPEGSRYGYSPLHRAATLNSAAAVRMLLAAGAHVNATNKHGTTPLHLAEDQTVAELLVLAGADLTARDDMQKTPAEIAGADRRYDVLAVLTNGVPAGPTEK